MIFLEGAPFAEYALQVETLDQGAVLPFARARLGPGGSDQIRVPINSYDEYMIVLAAPTFKGDPFTFIDWQTVTVTANEDCFPDPN